MTSVLTNSGAMVALQSLEMTQAALTSTQNRISTGLKIASSKDNAAVWTVATTMKANVSSLSQVSTGLGNADSILGTAVSGANQVASLVASIRAQTVSLTDTSTNAAATGKNIQQLVNQIQATIGSSAFNGVNLLNADGAGAQFVAATNNDYTQAGQTVSTVINTGPTINLSSSNAPANANVTAFNTLMTALSASTTNITAAALDTNLATIDAFAATVKSQASALGATQSNVKSQKAFVDNLSTALTTGIGNMVDADMTAEFARLTALQTQQQLGVSALSIANQAPSAILKLFG